MVRAPQYFDIEIRVGVTVSPWFHHRHMQINSVLLLSSATCIYFWYCNVYLKLLASLCYIVFSSSVAIMEVEITASKFSMSLVVVGIFALVWHLYIMLVSNPSKIRQMLKNQGINGPKPKFLLGNILELKKMKDAAVVKHSRSSEPPLLHNCGALLLPFFDTWKHQFGMS